MKSNIAAQILMTVFILLTSSVSNSQPVIDFMEGDLNPGGVVSVYGNNFGSAADVLLWDDFENNTNGGPVVGTIPVIGSLWRSYNQDTSELVLCTSDDSYSGNNSVRLWIESRFTIGIGQFIDGIRDEVYCSFRRFRPDIGPFGPGLPQENIMRFWLGAFPFQHYSKLSYLPDQSYWGITPGDQSEPSAAGYFQLDNQFNAWNRWEVFFKNVDQFYIDWTVTVDGATKIDFNHRLLGLNVDGGDWAVNSFFIGGPMPGFEGTPFALLFDDVYLADGRARIEIGDHPDFNQCTWRDVMLPSLWQSGLITFSVPAQGLPPSDEYFLFVIDENGEISEGSDLSVPVTEKSLGSVKALFR